jgi:hypothetical protein
MILEKTDTGFSAYAVENLIYTLLSKYGQGRKKPSDILFIFENNRRRSK